MGTYVFKLPDVGEGVAQAEIVAWHVDVGDEIKEDQPLVDVMTEKATVEIGAPVSGRIVRRSGETGDMAAVGSELVAIATGDDGNIEAAPVKEQAPARAAAPVAPVETKRATQASAVPDAGPPASTGKVIAAPAVRARAAALGIDLTSIKGSGPKGQVVHHDLDALLTRPLQGHPPAIRLQRDAIEEIRVIGLRRQIAQTMLEAKRTIPHFTYVEEVDVTDLERVRRELNEATSEDRPRLTLLPFLIRSLVSVLPDHPGINAHFDAEAQIIRRHAAIHIGIATQTPRGLVVPVIRHAESLELSALAREIARLSEAARAGKASREELSGSTITVTSLGSLGGLAATPIIKPPEVAIIGVNRIVERAVVRDGQIVVRRMMNLSSSFDHRIVDGYDAASFIQAVKERLEAPARLLVAS
jgi:2-oxoisovalerate dehydrogenase E2 component (dihydrolipoyl transacylase)